MLSQDKSTSKSAGKQVCDYAILSTHYEVPQYALKRKQYHKLCEELTLTRSLGFMEKAQKKRKKVSKKSDDDDDNSSADDENHALKKQKSNTGNGIIVSTKSSDEFKDLKNQKGIKTAQDYKLKSQTSKQALQGKDYKTYMLVDYTDSDEDDKDKTSNSKVIVDADPDLMGSGSDSGSDSDDNGDTKTTWIKMPRAFGIQKFGIPSSEDRIHLSNGIAMLPDLQYTGTLDEKCRKQITCTTKCLDAISACRGAMLNVPPGVGKTQMALFIAMSLKRKVLWIQHKGDLSKQSSERARGLVPGIRIGFIDGKRTDYKCKDIVFATVQKLYNRMFPDHKKKTAKAVKAVSKKPKKEKEQIIWNQAFFDQFGTVVIDEVHHYAAEKFSQVISKLRPMNFLGMSATDKRKDCLENLIYWNLGPQIKETIDRKQQVNVVVDTFTPTSKKEHFMYRRRFNVNAEGDDDDHGGGSNRGDEKKIMLTFMINDLAKDEKRNQFLATRIAKLFIDHPDRKILALSLRCDQLIQIQHLVGILLNPIAKTKLEPVYDYLLKNALHKETTDLVKSYVGDNHGQFHFYDESSVYISKSHKTKLNLDPFVDATNNVKDVTKKSKAVIKIDDNIGDIDTNSESSESESSNDDNSDKKNNASNASNACAFKMIKQKLSTEEILSKRVIFSTCQMSAEGLDLKDHNTLIFLLPGNNLEQCCFRILRKSYTTVGTQTATDGTESAKQNSTKDLKDSESPLGLESEFKVQKINFKPISSAEWEKKTIQLQQQIVRPKVAAEIGTVPLIIDVHDQFSIFNGLYYKRQGIYKSLNFTILK